MSAELQGEPNEVMSDDLLVLERRWKAMAKPLSIVEHLLAHAANMAVRFGASEESAVGCLRRHYAYANEAARRHRAKGRLS